MSLETSLGPVPVCRTQQSLQLSRGGRMQGKVHFLCPWGMLLPKHLLLDFRSVVVIRVMARNGYNMGLKSQRLWSQLLLVSYVTLGFFLAPFVLQFPLL